ncbi:MAG: DUF370 domain-containing protein [Oscillospiraceae bacterium]|nr:DUF370 domain-containing protein [Oscillospiraceae bacterium]
MFLHIGNNVTVPESDVIGIFDLDNTTWGKTTRDFLSKAEKEKRVITVTDELPKSFVVCAEPSSVKIYISQIASQTLAERGRNHPWRTF